MRVPYPPEGPYRANRAAPRNPLGVDLSSITEPSSMNTHGNRSHGPIDGPIPRSQAPGTPGCRVRTGPDRAAMPRPCHRSELG